MSVRYAGVRSNDTVDCLDGVCVSLWLQGCPHHCEGCHNPETWDVLGGYELPSDYIDKILVLLRKNGIHRDLSILGGEPMIDDNLDIILPLLKRVKSVYPDTKIYLWSGYTYETLIKRSKAFQAISLADVLIDGRFDLSHRDITLPLRGSPNQRVIDIPATLAGGKVVLWDRVYKNT